MATLLLQNPGNNPFANSVFFREQDRRGVTIWFRDDVEAIFLSVGVIRNNRKAVGSRHVVRTPIDVVDVSIIPNQMAFKTVNHILSVELIGRFSRHQNHPEFADHDVKWNCFPFF